LHNGKTYIAMEKVRRLLQKGKRVLLTCFNRNLGFYLQKELAGQVEGGRLTVTNFHDLLMQLLAEKGQAPAVPQEQAERGHFFGEELPDLAFSLVSTLAEGEKYDALVVDEGQDFREEWFLILQETGGRVHCPTLSNCIAIF